jgi:hypothetical protein
MVSPKSLAIVGGILAVIAGLVSLGTAEPLVSHLLKAAGLIGEPLFSGTFVRVLGVIGLAGGAGAIYFANKGDGAKTMAAGVAGLLAPCGLAVLSIIGGYMMQKEAQKR